MGAVALDSFIGSWLAARSDANEITQVKDLLDPVDLAGAVVTADAAHARLDTAGYTAGVCQADYLLTVKDIQPGLQRATSDKVSGLRHQAGPH